MSDTRRKNARQPCPPCLRAPSRVSSHRVAGSLAEYREFGNGVAKLQIDVSLLAFVSS